MSQKQARKSVVTIGTFDGIHQGHRALFKTARSIALSKDLKSIAYTFEKPPQNYFGNPKMLLMPPQKKVQLLRQFVDQVEVSNFSSVQALTAERFVTSILIEQLRMTAVVIGEDFRFGKDREGSARLLQSLGREIQYDVFVEKSVVIDERPVSSTAIRNALSEGDVELANRFLGEPFHLWGRVVRGQGQASDLGFPTANLELDPEVLVPASGIYAAKAKHHHTSELMAALYIGNRPTFSGRHTSVEVHLLDAGAPDLYGEELEVSLFHRIREDKKFDSFNELQNQIAADIEAVRAYFCSASGDLQPGADAGESS